MSMTEERLLHLEKIALAATPGPWSWFGNTKMHEVYLATVDRGHVFIMDFVRWGMQAGQPRFQIREKGDGSPFHRLSIMRSLGDLAKEGHPEGPIFEATHRRHFHGIGNPDAKHIAAASPDAVLELIQLVRDANLARIQKEAEAAAWPSVEKWRSRALKAEEDLWVRKEEVDKMAAENAKLHAENADLRARVLSA